jgi:hypothetical protein
MNGQYRVKNADLKPLYDEAQSLLRQFDHATIDHNYRHKNALADKLANLAMDRRADVTEVDGEPDGPRGSPRNPADDVDAPAPVAPRAGDRFACARCGCVVRIEQPTGVRPHQLKPFACQCGAKMQSAPQ